MGGNLDKPAARLKRMVDQDDVFDALSNVIDPELGLDFVELGLIYGVEIDGGTVGRHLHAHHAGVSDRTAGVRADGRVRRRAARRRPRSNPTMVFTPPWSPEKMSEDAKFALGY